MGRRNGIYNYELYWDGTDELISSFRGPEDAYDYGDIIPLFGEKYEVVGIGFDGETYSLAVQYADD